MKAHIAKLLAGMATKLLAGPLLAADAADDLKVQTLALKSVAEKIFRTQQDRRLYFRPYSKAQRQVLSG